ncbi:MAG: DUF3592 domain-containing protein [Planctomycetes bacterium]|nr:DUF3592 domain-containing protein [Planctomycetota bacterium]
MRFRSRRPSRPITLLIAGAVVALVGGGLAMFNITQGARLGGLQDHGQQIEGQAIGASHRETRRSKGGISHHYYVQVRFDTPTGEHIDSEKEVASFVYGKYTGSSPSYPKPVAILFDPLDKTNWAIAENLGQSQSEAKTGLWIGLGVAALGGILAFAALVQAKHRGGLMALPAGYESSMPASYLSRHYHQPYPEHPQYPQQPHPGAAVSYPQTPHPGAVQPPYQPYPQRPQTPYRPPQPPR